MPRLNELRNIRNGAQDRAAPLPYLRRGDPTYVPEKVEYIYYTTIKVEKEKEITDANGITTTVKETETQQQKKKVYLQIYRQEPTRGEDIEHFFEAFLHLQRELDNIWTTTSAAKANDATTLFAAFGRSLDGPALKLWQSTLVS